MQIPTISQTNDLAIRLSYLAYLICLSTILTCVCSKNYTYYSKNYWICNKHANFFHVELYQYLFLCYWDAVAFAWGIWLFFFSLPKRGEISFKNVLFIIVLNSKSWYFFLYSHIWYLHMLTLRFLADSTMFIRLWEDFK